jgi:hypothetical protein
MNTRLQTMLGVLTVLLFACAGDEATPPTDDDVGDGDGDDATETGDETGDECQGPDGCFACEPTNATELSNACTDASCEPFANTPERLPLLERDGSLPPLP